MVLLPGQRIAAQAEDPVKADSERDWWTSRFSGEWRSWLPADDFPPEQQESPHMLIYEVTQDPYGNPTPAQLEAAKRLVDESIAAAHRNGWFEFEKAMQDGYEAMVDDRAHYANREYVTDGRVFDPERPEFLMYYDTSSGKKLVGSMYLMSDLVEHGPQIGGQNTIWHYHIWSVNRCLYENLLVIDSVDDQGACAEGVPSHRSAEMIHVWFLDHPEGSFATNMVLPPSLMRELEERPY